MYDRDQRRNEEKPDYRSNYEKSEAAVEAGNHQQAQVFALLAIADAIAQGPVNTDG